MATTSTFVVAYSVSPARVHGAFSSAEYWRDRMRDIGGADPELIELRADADGLFVALRQSAPRDAIPEPARRLATRLRIVRQERWGALTGSVARGTFAAELPGVRGTLTGAMELRPSKSGAEQNYAGTIDAGIPVLGGRIERLLIAPLERLATLERDYTVQWINSQKHL